MFKRISVLFVAVMAVFAMSSGASAVVITFDDLEAPGTSATRVSSYSSSGYTFTSSSNSFASWNTGNKNYNTSAALFENYGSITLTADSGGLFSLDAIDLDLVYLSGTANVTFKGYDLSNTLVGTYSTWLNRDGWRHINFGILFSNVGSVQWAQTSDGHHFDNVTLSSTSVPEPSTLLLLGGGLVGLGFVRRKFKA